MSFTSYATYIVALSGLSAGVYLYIYAPDVIQRYSGKRNHIAASRFNEEVSLMHRELSELIQLRFEEVPEDIKQTSDFRKIFDLDSGNNRFVGVIFSGCISLSVLLIFLMMCEIGDILFKEEDRLSLFWLTIHSLMLLLTLVQPFLISSLLVNQDVIPRTQKRRLFATLSIFFAWLFLLHKCGKLTQSFSQQMSRSFVENKINEISMAGITVLAILSGIGSTSTPYRVYGLDARLERAISKWSASPKKNRDLVTITDINNLIQSYNSTSTLLSKRKVELNRLSVETGGTAYNSADGNEKVSHKRPPKLGEIIHKVSSFASISSLVSGSGENGELTQEVNSLASVKANVYDELTRAVSKFVGQKRGKPQAHEVLLKWANLLFGVYCVYRIVNVIFLRIPYFMMHPTEDKYEVHSPETNVIVDGESHKEITSTKDALATTLAKIILGVFSLGGVSETQLTNQLSFVLSGSLFICSMSNVFVTFKSFTHILPNNNRHDKNVKMWLKHLFVAELLGIYVMATALLIRTNLPTKLSFHISQILSLSGHGVNTVAGSIREVAFIDRWFDKVFAMTCVCTILSIVVKKWWEEDQEEQYADFLV